MKNWKARIKQVDGWIVPQTIEKAPKDKQLLVALELSVAKWHPNKKRRGGGACGLCYWVSVIRGKDCTKCLLAKKDKACLDRASTYSNFSAAKSEFMKKQYADKMYALLLKFYEKEKEKG